MAKRRSCAIIPSVISPEGQKVDSKLYMDVLKFASNNRRIANSVYSTIKSPNFKEGEWYSRLEFDSNGEPTFKSLLQYTNIRSRISDDSIIRQLNSEIGHYDKDGRIKVYQKTAENRDALEEKAITFNNSSEYKDQYVANVTTVVNEETKEPSLEISVNRKNTDNSSTAQKMQYNKILNDRLREILAEKGVRVGVLTDLEERMGLNGVTDFDQARNAAEGLIELIRLRSGVYGEEALPEEFAHAALEMLDGNPLIDRLLNLIISKNLAQEILGDEFNAYNNTYNGDEIKLAKEAAGKLLAKHLLRNERILSGKSYKNILNRVIDAVKNFLGKFDPRKIRRAIVEADAEMGEIARQILLGGLTNEMNLGNIHQEGQFYSIKEKIDRHAKLLDKIIKSEKRKAAISKKRNASEASRVKLSLNIAALEDSSGIVVDELKDVDDINEALLGIYMFCKQAMDMIGQCDERLTRISTDPTISMQKRANTLRNVRDYLFSYRNLIEGDDGIRAMLTNDPELRNSEYGKRLQIILNQVSGLMEDTFRREHDLALPLFVDFIKPYIGKVIEIPFGKYKGKRITAEELVKMADKDISLASRWLDSVADSSDYMLKVLDKAVKKSKENARLNTIEMSKQIMAAGRKLEQAGVKNFNWMFERDEDGNLTGNYISKYNWDAYNKARREMYNELERKYGTDPVGEDFSRYKEEEKAWYRENTIYTYDGEYVPKESKYGNPAFRELTEAQLEFYNTIMKIKEKLDSYLPPKYTHLYNAVKIRKDLVERVVSARSVGNAAGEIWENIKDDFIRRSDNTEFGEKATLMDFENNEVQLLPIYYTKMRKGESANDMSTDVISTMIAYASMANDYNEMNKVIDLLEVGRSILSERQIQQRRGGKNLMEVIEVGGKKIEQPLTKSGNETHFMQRLNDYYEMQVYGRYIKDEGTILGSNIDVGKTFNWLNRITALNTYALNLLSGISNVATGMVMMRIESFSGEFFNETDTLIADKNYAAALPAYLGEVGNRVKTSKLALWDEKFNVMQEYEENVREVNWNRKTWFSRLFQENTLFFLNNCGEHWMQNRTSLALANRYKMHAPDGTIVSLWDAMEVVYLDPNDHKMGATLEVKEGYTKEDGTEFTRDDLIAFSRRIAGINQRLHGIYNKLDRNAIQKMGWGRLVMMYRKWMVPAFNRRFGGITYNYDLDAWVEGYYRTTGRFLFQCCRDLRKGELSLSARWDELTQTERCNITRTFTELINLGLILAASLLTSGWKDKDNPWYKRLIAYQAQRLLTEIGSMTPSPIQIYELMTIVKSPAAAVNILEKTFALFGCLNPWNYEFIGGEDAILKSGKYKGHSKAYRAFMNSPLVPMYSTIYRATHPEIAINYYMQNY